MSRSVAAMSVLVGVAVLASSLMVLTPAGCASGQSSSAPTAQTAKAVNAKCPIMGNAIDSAKVPQELTRVYKGQTVGFCCAMCPPAWDKLTDAEKDAKLQAAMPK